MRLLGVLFLIFFVLNVISADFNYQRPNQASQKSKTITNGPASVAALKQSTRIATGESQDTGTTVGSEETSTTGSAAEEISAAPDTDP